MTRSELLTKLPKNLSWAELGVFVGDFSKEIYNICEPSTLHLVDTFPDNMISGDKDGNNIRVLNLESVPVNLESHFNDSKVIIHKTTTKEFLENCIFKNITLDAVYIDADHSYESVKSDLNLSYEIVTDGGYICGHDYSEEHFYGVFKAVNEFCDDKNLKINYLSKDGCPTYCIKK